jgi:hypothetical protein
VNYKSDIATGGFVDDKFRQAQPRITLKDAAATATAGSAEERRKLHLDQLLDQALDESFPASDPPSVGRSS